MLNGCITRQALPFLVHLQNLSYNCHTPKCSKRSPKARHEAESFEPAEWSERPTPGQSGWLGAAAVGSVPALALAHSQKVNKKILLFLRLSKKMVGLGRFNYSTLKQVAKFCLQPTINLVAFYFIGILFGLGAEGFFNVGFSGV